MSSSKYNSFLSARTSDRFKKISSGKTDLLFMMMRPSSQSGSVNKDCCVDFLPDYAAFPKYLDLELPGPTEAKRAFMYCCRDDLRVTPLTTALTKYVDRQMLARQIGLAPAAKSPVQTGEKHPYGWYKTLYNGVNQTAAALQAAA